MSSLAHVPSHCPNCSPAPLETVQSEGVSGARRRGEAAEEKLAADKLAAEAKAAMEKSAAEDTAKADAEKAGRPPQRQRRRQR